MIHGDFQLASADQELWSLTESLCDGSISPNQLESLESLLRDDEQARLFFASYMDVHGRLLWRFRSGGQTAPDMNESEPAKISIAIDTEPEPFSLYPLSALSTTHHPPSTPFVGGPVFSYMVATLVLCMMLLGAWAYKITIDAPIATNDPSPSLIEEDSRYVARITGAKECQWPADAIAPMVGSYVPLGRKYSLDAGLFEITYKSGARVILEGPCEYTVDSITGGFLRIGKLTALVATKAEDGWRMADGERMKGSISSPLATSHQPLSTASSPFPLPLSTFVVKTPTAIVTDLGTEFGVEVTENGDTISHVFQGIVEVQTISAPEAKDGMESPEAMRLRLTAGQTARVKQSNLGENASLTRIAIAQPTFVRRLHNPPKLLDILDIVAGGDGLGVHRERGIDPATGKQDAYFLRDRRTAQQQYTPVNWNRFVDGVFIPMYGEAPPGVQLDSAGHAYDGFAIFKYKSAPMRRTVGSVWARAADVSEINKSKNRWFWIYTMGTGEQFMPERKGLLCMRANVGITFDLKALRTAHEGARPSQFRAVAGLADASEIMADKDPVGMADLWVFVDGQLKQQRLKLQSQEGPVKINVELGPSDRFLTLVTTDSADGANFDWAVWGDPILEMISTNPEDQQDTEEVRSPDRTNR